MNQFSINNDHVTCTVSIVGNQVRIVGNVYEPAAYATMVLLAPNPPTRMTSYSGSALPYPCANMAFDNTPNQEVISSSGEFDTTFVYPNSYYEQSATNKIPPSVFFILKKANVNEDPIYVRVGLEDPAILRTLTHRIGRTGPEFYATKDTIIAPQTAEKTMRTLKVYKSKFDIA